MRTSRLFAFLMTVAAACGGGGGSADPDAGGDDDTPVPDAGLDAGVACSATTESTDPDFAAYLDFVRARMASAQLPGMAIAILDGDGTVVHQAVLGSKGPGVCGAITADTRFRLGGLTPAITATALAAADEEGLLDLDDPLDAHIPELGVPATITLRQLLTRSTGYDFSAWPPLGATCPAALASVDGWVTDHMGRTQYFPPGTAYAWDWSTYTAAGIALERSLTAMTFEQYATSHVLDKLGMTSTYSQAEALSGDFALPTYDGVTTQVWPDCRMLHGHDQLFGSLNDVIALTQFLLHGDAAVVSNGAWSELRSIDGAPSDYPHWTQGHVLMGIPYGADGSVVYALQGLAQGHSMAIFLAPDHDIAVIVMIDRFYEGLDDFVVEAFEQLADYVYDPPYTSTPVATWGEYAGTYVDDVGIPGVPPPRTFVVGFDGTDLTIDIGGVTVALTPAFSTYAGRPIDEDVFEFMFNGDTYRIRFYRDTGGVPSMIYGDTLGPAAIRQ